MFEAPDEVYYYEYKPHDGDFWIKTVDLVEPTPSEVFEKPEQHVRNVQTYELTTDDD